MNLNGAQVMGSARWIDGTKWAATDWSIDHVLIQDRRPGAEVQEECIDQSEARLLPHGCTDAAWAVDFAS